MQIELFVLLVGFVNGQVKDFLQIRICVFIDQTWRQREGEREKETSG